MSGVGIILKATDQKKEELRDHAAAKDLRVASNAWKELVSSDFPAALEEKVFIALCVRSKTQNSTIKDKATHFITDSMKNLDEEEKSRILEKCANESLKENFRRIAEGDASADSVKHYTSNILEIVKEYPTFSKEAATEITDLLRKKSSTDSIEASAELKKELNLTKQ
ncbi:MAG: hypothetical protein ABSD68_00080 [Candidatus Micrarchaeales archaeon]|jgi:DNA-directed RNA polymerase subunit H (RpoH/RPB5)